MTVDALIQLLQQVILFVLDAILLNVQIITSMLETMFRTARPKPQKSLLGEVAVVTGAGHGIGRELAMQLSEMGVKVACWDINRVGCEETVKMLESEGGTGLAVTCDVSNREAVGKAAQFSRVQLGEVSMLFNNAGIMPCKPFLHFSPAEIEKVFSVNVMSQYWTLMEFLPRMASLRRGHIVSMCSMAGVTGTPNLVPYCSSKFAIKGLMDSLFLELRLTHPESNIKMTTIHPFTVDTGLAKKPRSRFQSVLPITSPESAAEQVIVAVRREYEYAYIPAILCPLTAVSKFLPRKAQLAIMDFLDCACDPHDDD